MLFTALSPVSHHGKLGGKALIPNGTKRMPNKDLGPLSDSLSGRGGWSDKLDRLTFVSIQLLVFTIPLERALVVPGESSIPGLLGLVAAGFALLTVCSRPDFSPLGRTDCWIAAFVGWTGVSLLWSIAPDRTLQRVLTFAQLLAFVWLIGLFVQGRRRQLSLLRAYVLGTAVPAIVTITRYLSADPLLDSDGFSTFRYAAFGSPNQIGYLLALSIPISCYLGAAESRRALSWLYRLHLGIAGWGLLLTGSRGAFLVGIAMLAYIPIAFSQLPAKRRTAEIVIRFIIVCSLPLVSPMTAPLRLGTSATAELILDDPDRRLTIWYAGLQAWRESPILGTGAGTFAIAVEPLLSKMHSAHNVFVGLLLEGGVIGLSLFLSMLIAVASRARWFPRADRRLWGFLFVCWLGPAMLMSWEYAKSGWMLFGLCVAWNVRKPQSGPRKALEDIGSA